jgi:hypothetical protein
VPFTLPQHTLEYLLHTLREELSTCALFAFNVLGSRGNLAIVLSSSLALSKDVPNCYTNTYDEKKSIYHFVAKALGDNEI